MEYADQIGMCGIFEADSTQRLHGYGWQLSDFLPSTACRHGGDCRVACAGVLLRFMRTAKNTWLSRVLVFLAYVLSIPLAAEECRSACSASWET